MFSVKLCVLLNQEKMRLCMTCKQQKTKGSLTLSKENITHTIGFLMICVF